MPCKPCSAVAQNIGVLSTLFQPQMQSTAQYGLLCRKFTPSQPDSIQGQISGFFGRPFLSVGTLTESVVFHIYLEKCKAQLISPQQRYRSCNKSLLQVHLAVKAGFLLYILIILNSG